MEGATCKRATESVSCWKIHSLNHTYVCDDIEWSCTRLFYRSYHLPCRHG
ncbi:hypothetical protein JG687_00008039 [Phytophthora cactorum]|uniref:Uncharacterized protein n=1 Tax=Phytophthora cactorum TaxID=29920 RepID=A0A8T1UF15_9STRA|nr:hypothetical protein JG687_00008039 [Phytophthora cactorum]